MQLEDVPIEKIHIGSRFRKDEGDLESLAANIRDIGLLQPVGVDAYYNLIFGLRRLRACRDILEWQNIPCAIFEIDSLIAGEYAENEFRKQFTPSERTAIGRAIEEELGNRQGQRTELVPNWAEVPKGNTRDIAAKRAGFSSGNQYERVKTVIDHGSPELIKAMDKGEVAISAAEVIASQPQPEQARILAMPKDERREVVRDIRQKKAEREADEQHARDIRIYSDLYESVQFLARFYEEPKEAWAGIARVNGFDFDDLLHKAIQCLVRLEKGNPNDRKPELAKKVL